MITANQIQSITYPMVVAMNAMRRGPLRDIPQHAWTFDGLRALGLATPIDHATLGRYWVLTPEGRSIVQPTERA